MGSAEIVVMYEARRAVTINMFREDIMVDQIRVTCELDVSILLERERTDIRFPSHPGRGSCTPKARI
jgi:hypothetical protein